MSEPRDRRPVDHDRTVVECSRAGQGQRESGVIGAAVVEEVARRQPLGGQRRHPFQRFVPLEPSVALADAPAAREVVQPHRRPHRPGQLGVDQAVLGEDGQQERLDAHQMRSVPQQPAPLVQGLVDQADVALLQVAQPSVDELGGLRRGARREVVSLDQGDAQPSAGGVQGDAAPGDAASHHEQVEPSRPEGGDVVGTVERGGAQGSHSMRRAPGWSPSTVEDDRTPRVGVPSRKMVTVRTDNGC